MAAITAFLTRKRIQKPETTKNPRKTTQTTENHKKNKETIENQEKNVGESNNKCTARCLPTTPGPRVSWRVA
jgi:hypothetical protein